MPEGYRLVSILIIIKSLIIHKFKPCQIKKAGVSIEPEGFKLCFLIHPVRTAHLVCVCIFKSWSKSVVSKVGFCQIVINWLF